MIYADTSFLFSLYARDGNTPVADKTYRADARRPLFFTPWQRLELRNTIRLAEHRLHALRLPVPFQAGNVFKRIETDLADGRLKHVDPDWPDVLRLAENLSARHTLALGCAAVDLWHVAAALVLEADTFWTFDGDQFDLAEAHGGFRRLPNLPKPYLFRSDAFLGTSPGWAGKRTVDPRPCGA